MKVFYFLLFAVRTRLFTSIAHDDAFLDTGDCLDILLAFRHVQHVFFAVGTRGFGLIHVPFHPLHQTQNMKRLSPTSWTIRVPFAFHNDCKDELKLESLLVDGFGSRDCASSVFWFLFLPHISWVVCINPPTPPPSYPLKRTTPTLTKSPTAPWGFKSLHNKGKLKDSYHSPDSRARRALRSYNLHIV